MSQRSGYSIPAIFETDKVVEESAWLHHDVIPFYEAYACPCANLRCAGLVRFPVSPAASLPYYVERFSCN